ncbi:MAG: HAD family phosphatase [Candidatus Saccharimonadales bacterium]
MPTKAIIFDLYGVLGLNGWQAFKLKHFSERPQDWEHLRALGQRVDTGQATQAELVQALVATTGESTATIRYQFEHTVPNVELLDYIETLRPRYKIGLLSNASHDVVGEVFTREQAQLFDEMVSSFHVGLAKPDPKMFRLMAQKLGVDPSECVMVDDQTRHIAAAKKLGMKTVLYASVEQTKEAIEGLIT